jgi:very-short-patch-repair endonuclease
MTRVEVGAPAYRDPMPEHVEAWWTRRQWSKAATVPYAVGEFRESWQQYPVLVRQYHPDLNHGLALTQVPPAADVYLLWECDAGHRFVATPWEQRQRPGRSRRRSTWCPECTAGAGGRIGARSRSRPLCSRSGTGDPGEPITSPCAPRVASAAEARLKQLLTDRIEYREGLTAVRVARPFFDHLEVWPDIVLGDLRVAIEYDTTGRDGLEHVGTRETVDKRKDRLLRQVEWEVIRVRCGKLQPIGPWDVPASGVSRRVVDAILDQLRAIRGDLIVNSYLR